MLYFLKPNPIFGSQQNCLFYDKTSSTCLKYKANFHLQNLLLVFVSKSFLVCYNGHCTNSSLKVTHFSTLKVHIYVLFKLTLVLLFYFIFFFGFLTTHEPKDSITVFISTLTVFILLESTRFCFNTFIFCVKHFYSNIYNNFIMKLCSS